MDSKSAEALSQCDVVLIDLFHKVHERISFKAIFGYRGEADQNKAYDSGFSKLKFPLSKHNTSPSRAVDVVPLPINWTDIEAFKKFGFFVLGVAHGIGVKVRWGADWNMDMNTKNETFLDYAHYELI